MFAGDPLRPVFETVSADDRRTEHEYSRAGVARPVASEHHEGADMDEAGHNSTGAAARRRARRVRLALVGVVLAVLLTSGVLAVVRYAGAPVAAKECAIHA
ncbi:MAG: hypothetical protein ACRDPR_19455, partial [Nocardioidaceae bacterium]